MDCRPQFQEVSLENVRESLIAISYCDPERFELTTEPIIAKAEDNIVLVAAASNKKTVVDELRSKLMSISVDWVGNNCNSYGNV